MPRRRISRIPKTSDSESFADPWRDPRAFSPILFACRMFSPMLTYSRLSGRLFRFLPSMWFTVSSPRLQPEERGRDQPMHCAAPCRIVNAQADLFISAHKRWLEDRRAPRPIKGIESDCASNRPVCRGFVVAIESRNDTPAQRRFSFLVAHRSRPNVFG